MDNVVESLIDHFGILALLLVLVLTLVAVVLVHFLAAPGKQVSLLYGLVSYTKREAKFAPPKSERPIEVIHEFTGTLWRIMRPLEEWIDQDLTALGSTYKTSLLAGPHHAKCKTDLSYLDKSSRHRTYRVRKTCPACDVEVIPDNIDNDRTAFKEVLLKQIQETHLRGEKIGNGKLI